MDGKTVQLKVWRGYALAAARLGNPYDLYRPSGPLNAIGQQNRIGRITASFDASTYTYGKPNLYGKPVWYVLLDGSLIKRGDYLADPCCGSIYFVAAFQALLPIACVECNRTLNVLRPAAPAILGQQGYGGDIVSTETPVMTGFPASVLTKSRGERGTTNLPGDVRTPWYEVLLPSVSGSPIKFADVLTDENGERYKVSSAEETDLGWRLMAQSADT